jgi:hypothetical protein
MKEKLWDLINRSKFLGYMNSERQNDTNMSYVNYCIIENRFRMYIYEDDFKCDISVESKLHPFFKQYAGYKVRTYKFYPERIVSYGEGFNLHRQFVEEELPVNMTEDICDIMIEFIESADVTKLLLKKFEYNLSVTLHKLLSANFSTKPGGAASCKSMGSSSQAHHVQDSATSVLERLSKHPLKLSWIPYDYLTDASFMDLVSLKEMLEQTSYFINKKREIKEKHKRNLVLVERDGSLYVSCSKFKLLDFYTGIEDEHGDI